MRGWSIVTSQTLVALAMGLTLSFPADAQDDPGGATDAVVEAATGPASASADQALSDADMQTILDLACRTKHPAERYNGLQRKFDVLGPLWLSRPNDQRARGVILPPAMRVYLRGRDRSCGKMTLDDVRDVAGPEVWVVLWRIEDPPCPSWQRCNDSGQKLLVPTEIRYHADNTWHNPMWIRTEDSMVAGWYWDDWNEEQSLIAAFPTLHRSGSLHAEYRVEERGRSYLTESEIFTLAYSDKWWQAAFDVPQE